MRSGWPHTQDDHGRLATDQRQVPFGPDISWPTGYSDLEYRDGEYRYPAPYTPQPPASHGEHPYAAFSGSGYGDDAGGYGRPSAADHGYGDPGYSDLGYDGPASQDSGIAGTRTVRGFVETTQAPSGYAGPGYALSAPTAQDYGYTAQDYDEPAHIELAYPPATPEAYPAPDAYQQPWDYDRPLRYDGEEPAYPDPDGYRRQGRHADPDGYGPGARGAGAYDPAGYNGSTYSRPGIDGPGYDLSGIIGTGDFEAVGYDEPSYDRLSYDDPRYDDARHDDPRYDDPRHGDPRYDDPRHGDSRYGDAPGHGDYRYGAPARDAGRGNPASPRFDETRFDMPRYDDTRLDSLWLPDEDARREDEPVGYGNDGFGTDGPFRSGYQDPVPGGPAALAGPRPGRRRRGLDETRFDLRADDVRADHTRFDVPVFDETRIENMRALRPASGSGRPATSLLPPPERQPLNWPDETTIDALVADLYLDDEPEQQLPAAYVRTAERQGETGDDTGTRRAGGRRRGRSGDRRQWMALGAIAVVAAGAIGGVLMKYVFSGPSGPAHTVVAPDQAGAFTRMPNLEKQMQVQTLRNEVVKTSAGQASDVVSAVYAQGSTAPGSNAQIFMFIGGKLASAAPATSIANFTQTYPGAKVVPAGSLGGEAACAEATANGEGVAMCVWFDNDSFGELVSPTMSTTTLARTLDTVRPDLELYAK